MCDHKELLHSFLAHLQERRLSQVRELLAQDAEARRAEGRQMREEASKPLRRLLSLIIVPRSPHVIVSFFECWRQAPFFRTRMTTCCRSRLQAARQAHSSAEERQPLG